MVRVPFTAALEHVYDDNVAQAIELDKHGSFLYFLPSLFVHAHAPGRGPLMCPAAGGVLAQPARDAAGAGAGSAAYTRARHCCCAVELE